MLGHGVGLGVGALNSVAEIDQYFGNPAHAAAADADEVDSVDSPHAVAAIRGSPALDRRPLQIHAAVLGSAAFVDHAAPSAAIARHEAARSDAAFGFASRRARSAMASSLLRPAHSLCSSSDSRSAVRSRSAINT